MSNKSKTKSKSIFLKIGCFSFVLFVLPMCACSLFLFKDSIPYEAFVPEKLAQLLPPTPMPTPTPTPEPGRAARNLLFIGKSINHDETNWLNDRLVVVYLNGQEVGRTITEVGGGEFSEEGVTDGYFSIQVPNTYEISEDRFDFTAFEVKTDSGTIFSSKQTIWFGDMVEGGLYEIPVPTKNLSYFIKIFATKSIYLPPEMLEDGSTLLTEDNEIVLTLDWGDDELPSDSRILIQGITYNVSQESVEINTEIIPIDNCNGNSSVLQEISVSQTIYHEYTTEVGATAGLNLPIPVGWPNILVELQAKYGFKQGEINSKQVSSTIEVQPGTNVMYTVTWLETWESGIAVVKAGTDLLEVPFRVRKSITHKTDSEAFSCN